MTARRISSPARSSSARGSAMSIKEQRTPQSRQKSPPANVARHFGQIFIMSRRRRCTVEERGGQGGPVFRSCGAGTRPAPRTVEEALMLYVLAGILLLAWLLGFGVFHLTSAFIHFVLVLA